MGNFARKKFLLDGGNLTRSDFDNSNLFKTLKSKLKQHANIEHWLKSELAWLVCTKSKNKNGTGAMATAKMKFLLHYGIEIQI